MWEGMGLRYIIGIPSLGLCGCIDGGSSTRAFLVCVESHFIVYALGMMVVSLRLGGTYPQRLYVLFEMIARIICSP